MTEMMKEVKAFAQEYYLSMLKELTRPPRVEYPRRELGPRMFSFGAAPAFREDWAVRNERNHKLEVSVWHHTTPARGVVLYVHDMLGSRTNVVEVLAPLLAAGCSVAAVDCTASGLSEGTHVTLGYFERFDVAAVAAELRLRYSVGGPGEPPLILYGRGAGATACLLFADAADHRAQLRRADALALVKPSERAKRTERPLPTLPTAGRRRRSAAAVGRPRVLRRGLRGPAGGVRRRR